MDPSQQNRDFCGDSSSKVFDVTENEDSTQIQLSLWKNIVIQGEKMMVTVLKNCP